MHSPSISTLDTHHTLGISRYTYVLQCGCLTINRVVSEQDALLFGHDFPLWGTLFGCRFVWIIPWLTRGFPLSMWAKRVSAKALMALVRWMTMLEPVAIPKDNLARKLGSWKSSDVIIPSWFLAEHLYELIDAIEAVEPPSWRRFSLVLYCEGTKWQMEPGLCSGLNDSCATYDSVLY